MYEGDFADVMRPRSAGSHAPLVFKPCTNEFEFRWLPCRAREPRAMGGEVLALDLLLTAAVVGTLIYTYGNVKKEFLVCLLVFFTWFICFSIVFILPMDVSSVRCKLSCHSPTSNPR